MSLEHRRIRRLAVDQRTRALAAADVVGIRAILVHAKDAEAARFYSQFGFAPSPTDKVAAPGRQVLMAYEGISKKGDLAGFLAKDLYV